MVYLPFSGHRGVLKPIGCSLQIQGQGDGKGRDPHRPTKRLYLSFQLQNLLPGSSVPGASCLAVPCSSTGVVSLGEWPHRPPGCLSSSAFPFCSLPTDAVFTQSPRPFHSLCLTFLEALLPHVSPSPFWSPVYKISLLIVSPYPLFMLSYPLPYSPNFFQVSLLLKTLPWLPAASR